MDSTLETISRVPFVSRPVVSYDIGDGWVVRFHDGLGPNPVFLTPYNSASGFDVDEFFAYGHSDQLLAAVLNNQAILPRLIGLVGWIRSVGADLDVPQVRLVEARTAAPIVAVVAAVASPNSALSLRVSVSTDQSSTIRCAYCFDDVITAESSWTCPSCHVILHAECRASVPRCFTLGCDGRPRPTRAAVAVPATVVAPAVVAAPATQETDASEIMPTSSVGPTIRDVILSLLPSEDTIAVFLFAAFVVALIFLAITSR